jgi:hypothetical protein
MANDEDIIPWWALFEIIERTEKYYYVEHNTIPGHATRQRCPFHL